MCRLQSSGLTVNGKDVEGSGNHLFVGTILAFARRTKKICRTPQPRLTAFRVGSEPKFRGHSEYNAWVLTTIPQYLVNS
jgi:hypothetical protein